MRRELQSSADVDLLSDLHLDINRERRSGVPEVVFGGHKSTDQIIVALTRLARANGHALATRVIDDQAHHLETLLPDGFALTHHPLARAIVVTKKGFTPVQKSGRIGILTAGTSDMAVASEAALMARAMGCTVFEAHDVGVAGLHRLVRPLESMIESGVHVLIVVAGMDGALPAVVAGLVPVPVIGVPTSVGYGFGGSGEGALMTMLQSCAPGLVVVNIDNGIGAGSTAALIANQARS